MMCEGRVAVVTGAAGNGMGRSIALTLAREGASVVVNWRTIEGGAIRKRRGHADEVARRMTKEHGMKSEQFARLVESAG